MRLAAVTRATTGTAASVSRLLVTQVRQALQQAVAIGACSAYFPAACASLPVAICFTSQPYLPCFVIASRRVGTDFLAQENHPEGTRSA